MSTETLVTQDRIAEAEKLIRPFIRRTPVMRVDMRDFGAVAMPVDLKLELLQHSGSFKVRGAFTSLLTREVPAVGVVAASGGNHGAAVAYAARERGVPAHIFVPSVASPAKIDKIRSYGAELVVGGDRYADALAASEIYVEKSGALPIHAYDQAETMIGQGTLGKEIEEDLPQMTTLIVAVGGGGLIGGVASWMRGRVKIVAVESDGAPTLYEAFKAGKPVDAPAGGIAADSLAPKQVGQMMFPVAQKFVQPPILVTDEDILNAQKALWSGARLVTEPGGAAAFAALQSGKYVPGPDEKVCVLVCGSNTTAVNFG
ncbi:threonine/serine dehydratase [Rhizobium sp. XQZ8]|uniref:threonine/serine dehydratase n=1 Tax=Rhizobium populisoli TaxID=2859785 RepID=UPI001C67F172|nr:threonine/serine dehydratase [Rhizobium populisoli]MBW6423404.1 threonine/serine dehydratase [Rhizobium populisoli]